MRQEAVTTATGREFQIREERAAGSHDDGRWAVTDKAGHVCTAELEAREYVSTPKGTQPHERPWTRREVLLGVAHAVEMRLVSPPEVRAGQTFSVAVKAHDLYAANGKP